MHLLSYLATLAALSVNSTLAFPNERRFATAPFTPTNCKSGSAPPTNAPSCPIAGFPTTLSTTLTLTTATPLASWSSRPTAQATADKYTWQMVPKNSTEVRASENDGIDIYDIDVDSSDATFASLLAVKKYIVCYFSAGIMEFSRADTGCFNNKPGTGDYGCNFGGAYKDEFWLNTSSIQVRRIMQDRIDKAAKKHCSAIDPDNVDAFSENQNGIGATVKDSISFIQFLADEAHSRGMGIGLKNAIDLLPNVSSKVDFAVNEQCMQHEECDKYTDFLKAGHPVVNIEYPAGPEDTNVERSFAEAEADARCTAWQGLGLPKLATTLKGYPTISCGVSRCVSDAGVGKALPAVPSSGPLPIPDGCVDQ